MLFWNQTIVLIFHMFWTWQKPLKSVDIEFQISRDNRGVAGKILEVNKEMFLQKTKIYLQFCHHFPQAIWLYISFKRYSNVNGEFTTCEIGSNVFCEREIGYSSIWHNELEGEFWHFSMNILTRLCRGAF